jgi:hypothetical protein
MQIIINDKTNTVSLLNLTWEELFIISGALLQQEAGTENTQAGNITTEILDQIDLATEVAIGKVV